MKKKFKNRLAVTGSKSLLKAFEEELVNLGYNQRIISFSTENVLDVILINSSTAGGNGNYIHQASYLKENYDYSLNLPQYWDLALGLAAEVEEEIPEYVELLPGFDNQNTGKIFKTSDPVPNLPYWYESWTWEYLMKSLKKEYFKPSTKEAFEEQSKIKFKEGDWLYSKAYHSESIFKFKSYDNLKNGFVTDEYYQIHNNGELSTGKSDNYTTKYKARLATVEEVKRILIKVAEIKYPIGTRIKPSNLGLMADKLESVKVTKNNFYFSVSQYGMWVTSEQWNSIIYENGEWAEIVKEVKVNGYVVTKIDDTVVKVGCKNFIVNDLIKLKEFLHCYSGGCYNIDGKYWHYKDVKEIIDAFNKM